MGATELVELIGLYVLFAATPCSRLCEQRDLSDLRDLSDVSDRVEQSEAVEGRSDGQREWRRRERSARVALVEPGAAVVTLSAAPSAHCHRCSGGACADRALRRRRRGRGQRGHENEGTIVASTTLH